MVICLLPVIYFFSGLIHSQQQLKQVNYFLGQTPKNMGYLLCTAQIIPSSSRETTNINWAKPEDSIRANDLLILDTRAESKEVLPVYTTQKVWAGNINISHQEDIMQEAIQKECDIYTQVCQINRDDGGNVCSIDADIYILADQKNIEF